jgi:hypothetical protein
MPKPEDINYLLPNMRRVSGRALLNENNETLRLAFGANLPRGWAPSKPLCAMAAQQLTEHLAAPPEGRSHLPPEVLTLLLEMVAWVEYRAASAAEVVEHVVQGVTPSAELLETAYAGGRK